MSLAICFKCGAFKKGALTPCSKCGNLPKEKEDIKVSLALTNHFLNETELGELSQKIKEGNVISLENKDTEAIDNLIEQTGIESALKNIGGQNSSQKIQIEFFDFSEQAFEISQEIVSIREDIAKNSGTFFSVIKNLFKKVDYTQFLLKAQDFNNNVKHLKADINVFLSPENDLEKDFLKKLLIHVDDLESISRALIKKFQFMVNKSQSASTANTSWNDWKAIVEKEDNLIDKCQASGDNLTETFQQLQRA